MVALESLGLLALLHTDPTVLQDLQAMVLLAWLAIDLPVTGPVREALAQPTTLAPQSAHGRNSNHSKLDTSSILTIPIIRRTVEASKKKN